MNYLTYFLPAGSRVQVKPHNGNVSEYEAWVREIHRLSDIAAASALEFCIKYRHIADQGGDGSDSDETGAGGGAGRRKRKRDITGAFHGMHKRLSAIYNSNPQLFQEAPGVVVEAGRLPLQSEGDSV